MNILVAIHREDAAAHREIWKWWEALLASGAQFGASELALSGCIRVVTHPRIFDPPSTIQEALQFAEEVREHPQSTLVRPGPRHWQIFRRLCVEAGAKGGLVPDAYFAALAIENGCEWITLDRDFARFPGLKWRSPLRSS